MKRILLDRNEGIKSDQHIKKKKSMQNILGKYTFFFPPLGRTLIEGVNLVTFECCF